MPGREMVTWNEIRTRVSWVRGGTAHVGHKETQESSAEVTFRHRLGPGWRPKGAVQVEVRA